MTVWYSTYGFYVYSKSPMVDCGIPPVDEAAWGKQFRAFRRERMHGTPMDETLI